MIIMLSGGRPIDAVPDAFSFASQTDVAPSTVVVSNAVALTGFNAASPLQCTNCLCSINGGPFTTSGTVYVGDTLICKLTSSGAWSTAVQGQVVVGGTVATFSVTTIAQDVVPDAFTFTSVANAALSTEYISNSAVITGITGTVVTNCSNGLMSIDGGAWTTSGTIIAGQTVAVKTASSGSYSTANVVSLVVGSSTVTFTVTTMAVPSYCPNLTVTGNNQGMRYSGLSQLTVSSGKHYFEITSTYAQSYFAVSVNSAAVASIPFGGTVGVQLDADAGIIYCNGTSKSLSATPAPWAIMLGSGLGTATTNFGQSPFVGTVPAGYRAGFYA